VPQIKGKSSLVATSIFSSNILKLPFATAGKPFRKVHLINEKPRGRPKRVTERERKGERNRGSLWTVAVLPFWLFPMI